MLRYKFIYFIAGAATKVKEFLLLNTDGVISSKLC